MENLCVGFVVAIFMAMLRIVNGFITFTDKVFAEINRRLDDEL